MAVSRFDDSVGGGSFGLLLVGVIRLLFCGNCVAVVGFRSKCEKSIKQKLLIKVIKNQIINKHIR